MQNTGSHNGKMLLNILKWTWVIKHQRADINGNNYVYSD